MRTQARLDSLVKLLASLGSVLCSVGAAAALFVVLVRVPSLAQTKLELLYGTLLGVAVGLLFAIAALLIHLTYQVRLANRSGSCPSLGDGLIPIERAGPGDRAHGHS